MSRKLATAIIERCYDRGGPLVGTLRSIYYRWSAASSARQRAEYLEQYSDVNRRRKEERGR